MGVSNRRNLLGCLYLLSLSSELQASCFCWTSCAHISAVYIHQCWPYQNLPRTFKITSSSNKPISFAICLIIEWYNWVERDLKEHLVPTFLVGELKSSFSFPAFCSITLFSAQTVEVWDPLHAITCFWSLLLFQFTPPNMDFCWAVF